MISDNRQTREPTTELLIVDVLGWRVMSPMSDRERLITRHTELNAAP